MVAAYRYLSFDLLSMTALAELPLADVRYGGTLNGVGLLDATVPLTSRLARLWTDATVPERTVIFVERDGVIMDGYIIWVRVRAGGDQPSIRLQGASILSFPHRNRLVADLVYTATDQLTIARALITALQAQTGADIGIVVGSGTSGVTHDRTWFGYERKNIGEALEQLAAVDDGFDVAIDCYWSAGTPAMALNLGYPRLGRDAASTGVVFETGKNLRSYELTEDGTRSGRSVDCVGAGDGDSMLISTQTDTAQIDAGFPLTSVQLAFKDVVVQTTLDAHALAAVNARAVTPMFWTLDVDPDDVDGGLGSWVVGDDAVLVINDDNFPRQADGSDGYRDFHRVVGYTVNVPEAGKEIVSVVLGGLTDG